MIFDFIDSWTTNPIERTVVDTITLGDVTLEHVKLGGGKTRSYRYDVTCPTCVDITGRASGGAIGEFLRRDHAFRAAYEHEHIQVIDGADLAMAVA